MARRHRAVRASLAALLALLPAAAFAAEPAHEKPQAAEKAKPAAKPNKPPLKPTTAKSPLKPASDPAEPLESGKPEAELSHPDPQRGVGTRSLGALPAAAAAVPVAPEPSAEKPKKTEKPDKSEKQALRAPHQKGHPPHKPSATLPAGSPRLVPDRVARQKIADGPSDEELRAGKDDPELRSLRDAERVLFPRPLTGVEPGFRWDLPEPVASDAPEVVATGAPPSVSLDKPRLSALDGAPDAAWLKSLALPNLPVVLDEFVIKYLRFYRDSPSGKSIGKVWAKKSGRYAGAIRAELAKSGLPTDLVWLSMIESGHNPTISSPAGAAGLWQFMPDAGRTYGLTVDRWVDERLDPERSTEAASRYLSDLYRRFGSWELSIASYNMGYGGMVKAIRKFNTNDFWQLVRYEAGVPWETALYVPKIFALAIVMNNKKAFGLDTVPSDPPEAFDVVSVGPSVALDDVARAAGVELSALAAMNPEYLAGRTPPWLAGTPKPSWRVHVPLGKGSACTALLARNASSDDGFDTYSVKFGDTVEAVASAHGTSEARIRAINHVDPKEVLAAGTLLLLPRASTPASEAGVSEVVVVPPRQFSYSDRSRIFYRVLPGDTLARVARVFSVALGDLSSWNALDDSARLQAGMVLQLFVDKSRAVTSAHYVAANDTRVLVAGTPDFYDYFEAQNGRKRLIVSAREGDTLGTLGHRYGMSLGSIERINRRSRNDQLNAEESVVVYVDKGHTPATSRKPELEPEPAPVLSDALLAAEPADHEAAPDPIAVEPSSAQAKVTDAPASGARPSAAH
ncbi:MAG TPA: transglycosylase SLT domain-containing protein [Polyangiaceae bacterium]|jgi:membrane-bound lytic murein transglycosylase D